MSTKVEHDKPMITQVGIFDMQVCVPESWSNDEVEEWATKENPAGTERGWRMKRTGEESLRGANERVKCEGRDGFVHIMFAC